VTNTGETTATGVTVEVDLPAGVFYDGGGAEHGCTAPSGSNVRVTCTVDDLPAGQRVTVAFQVLTNGNGANGRAVVSWVRWDVPGGPAAVSAEVRTTLRVTAAPAPVVGMDLESPTTFAPSTAREVSVIVSNTGTAPATDVRATITLPAGVTWEGLPEDSRWSCTGTGSTRTCTLTGPLAPGSEVELAFVARATAAGGTIGVALATNEGVSAATTTAVELGSLPTCSTTTWWLLGYYPKGTVVSFRSWNWLALDNNFLVPPTWSDTRWQRIEPCA